MEKHKMYKGTEKLLTKDDLRPVDNILSAHMNKINTRCDIENNLIEEVVTIKYRILATDELFNSRLDLSTNIRVKNYHKYCYELAGGEGDVEFRNGIGYYELPIETYSIIMELANECKIELGGDSEISIFDRRYVEVLELRPLIYLLKCMFIKEGKCYRVGQIYYVDHFNEIQGGVLND